MSGLSLRRVSTRVFGDLVPRVLGRLGIHLRVPKGRLRPAEEDCSMEVPFRYPVPVPTGTPVGVVCHIFHVELAQPLFDAMSRIASAADVYISTDTSAKQVVIETVFAHWTLGTAQVRLAPNRGRDIAPKLVTFADVYDRHEIVLFLHSKQSPHLAFGTEWRDYLIRCLIGSPETVASILEIFRRRPDVGMVIPQHMPLMRRLNLIDWGENFLRSRRLAWQMGFDLQTDGYLDLPSGSMFWSRTSALRPLLDLRLSLDEFHLERGQIDMTTAHCIERLFLYACEKAGKTWVKVAVQDATQVDATIASIAEPSDVDRFIEMHRFELLGQ